MGGALGHSRQELAVYHDLKDFDHGTEQSTERLLELGKTQLIGGT
jgi:hypothetical protein